MPTILDYAKAYIDAGWPVLAVYTAPGSVCMCGDLNCKSAGKHPKLEYSPNGVTSATLDIDAVAAWEDYNIGIALGSRAGGLMVLDIDEQEIADDLLSDELGLSDTTSIVRTGRPGLHVYFISQGETATRIVKTTDGRRVGEMRGDGAYVVAPPSIAATGREYKMLGRSLADFTDNMATTRDPHAYVRELLAWVDAVAVFPSSDKKRDIPDSQAVSQDLPQAFETSHHVTPVRQHLALGPGTLSATGDRSKLLSGFAYRIRDGARAAGYDVTLEEIAGVLRKCDLVFTATKYDWRHDASRWYLEMAATALDAETPDATQPEPGDGTARVVSDYMWDAVDGWLYYQPQGSRMSRKVCNFLPKVIEVVTIDYGGDAKENRKSLLVSFSKADGRSVEFELRADDTRYDRLQQAIFNNCPVSYVVEDRMFGRLMTALQLLSSEEDVQQTRKYAHTGWTERDNKHYYLLPGADGAIGPNGIDRSIRLSQDALDDGEPLAADAFAPYGKLVRPALEPVEKDLAWKAFKALIECGDVKVTLPVALQVLTGPLLSVGLDVSSPAVHVLGRTGSLKTSFCRSALSMFGNFADTPPPIGWAKGLSTKAYILLCLARLKDVTVLIDDYKRRFSNPAEVAEIVQTVADKTTRGRARNNQSVRSSARPRGLILSNGEDIWENEASAEARTITVNLKKGDIDEHALFKDVTSSIRAGYLQMFGGSYLMWLAGEERVWNGAVTAHYERLREQFSEQSNGTEHLRVPATLATLFATFDCVHRFIRSYFGESAAADFYARRGTLLANRMELAHEQSEEIEEMSPYNEMMSAIADGVTSREVCFWPGDGVAFDRQRLPFLNRDCGACAKRLVQMRSFSILPCS